MLSRLLLTPNRHEDREGDGKVVVEKVGYADPLALQRFKVTRVTPRAHQKLGGVVTDTVPVSVSKQMVTKQISKQMISKQISIQMISKQISKH